MDAVYVGKLIANLAAMRERVRFNTWERIVLRWVALCNRHASSFNEAEFLLAIGYEAELYRVQNGGSSNG